MNMTRYSPTNLRATPWRPLLILTILWCAVSCADPPEIDSQDRFRVLDYDAEEERYELMESPISTLEDARSVEGDIVHLRGGGQIIMEHGNPQDETEFEEALRIEDSKTPRVSYEIEDGIVTAWDFDSLMMLTLYHHFERAAHYFEDIGVAHELVGNLPVYYAPRFQILLPFNLLTDNAAYAFTIDAFLMPQQFFLSGLPFAANRGVIVHEYSHAVFNRIVHDDARAPTYLVEPWPDPAINRMRALDEGVADVFGALATGDPDFISPSIAEEEFAVDRDLSADREYTNQLHSHVESQDSAIFNPYQLGSVVASTIWALRPYIDDITLGQALVATLEDFAEVEPPYDLSDFFDPLYDELPQDAQSEACTTFRQRLTAISERLQCEP